MAVPQAFEKIWFEKTQYDEAEHIYLEVQSKMAQPRQESLASQIEKARENIQSTLAGSRSTDCPVACKSSNLGNVERLELLEKKQEFLTISLKAMHESLEDILREIKSLKPEVLKTAPTAEPAKPVVKAPPAPAPKSIDPPAESDSDEVDLFGSDDEEEDAEAARIREERLKAYADKKAKKPGPIAKSSVLLDVKPWDDETDMIAVEKLVRSIEMDGLTWAAGQLVPLAFGIKKLSILCIVVDDKVSIDDLSEKIEAFEDHVQSVDIAAFNKI